MNPAGAVKGDRDETTKAEASEYCTRDGDYAVGLGAHCVQKTSVDDEAGGHEAFRALA